MALASLLFLIGAAGFVGGWFLCSRTQSNRISAALTVSELAKQVATVSTSAAASNGAVAARLEEHGRRMDSADAEMKLNTQVLDRLDRAVGSMTMALVNSGVLKALGPERGKERQRGEGGPEQSAPPLVPPSAAPAQR